MKNAVLFIAFLILFNLSHGQCLISTVTINTGYNPATGLVVPAGANGATPVPDPKWKITAVTPAIATALASTTSIPGLIEVVPVGSADVVQTRTGWAASAVAQWIDCVNTNLYNTDGDTSTILDMTVSRQFKTCVDDSIKLDINVANDNYIPSMNIDGTPLAFSQTAGFIAAYYSGFTHFTQTVHLTAGTHSFNIVQSNYSPPGGLNGAGMCLYGTVSSATGINSLVAEISSCSSYVCGATPSCSEVITLPDTIRTCAGTTITLPATLSGTDSVIDTLWTPPAGLSDPTSLTPTLIAGTSGWYYLTVKSLLNENLVINGDFSAGNVGFSSAYTYSPPPSTILIEGDYSVYTDPHGVHTGFTSFGDHTTGTGNMMIINGASSPVNVWCQTITVTPNTDYDFSAWFANCSSVTTGADVPILQFEINGILLGTPTTVTAAPGVWVNFSITWNSGTSTTANICINDALTAAAGNDFVIDDISFKPICKVVDSVYVDVVPKDTTFIRHDTSVCGATLPITLTAPTGYTTRVWNIGGSSLTISATAPGIYWVSSTAGCDTRLDTTHLTLFSNPVISFPPDTSICVGYVDTLSSPQPPGSTYLWSTGSTASSIMVSSPGSYELTVTNSDGCTGSDIISITVSPYPVVNLGPDTIDCQGLPITLQSSVAYTTPTYLWNDGSSASSLIASSTGNYWLQVTVGGCPSADSIHVTILYDTFKLANSDTAICKGGFIQVYANGNPSLTYQWRPTAGMPVSDISSPLITPDTSAMYVVTASMAGCPDILDSFFIDVQPIPDVYIGGNRLLCKYDTARINAFVGPPWYTHYSYSWTPVTYLDFPSSKVVTFTAGDTTHLVLIVSTPAGCKGYDSAVVSVWPGDFETVAKDTGICPRDSIQLWAAGGVSYRWSPSLYLDNATSATPWVRAITSQVYTVTGTSMYGCTDTLDVRVTVHPDAVMHLGDSVAIQPGQSYQINPQTNCTRFLWTPAGGLDSRYASNPLATPTVSTKYMVSAYTEYGCKTVDSFTINVDDGSLISLPNAFAPGSGGNGKLYILNKGIAKLNYFRIYNRWGNLVFQTENIEEGWDGTYKGVPQPLDVFVYEVQAVTTAGTVVSKSGNVTLLR